MPSRILESAGREGMVTPQKRVNTMIMNGFVSTAMDLLVIIAEIVYPSVTENSSI